MCIRDSLWGAQLFAALYQSGRLCWQRRNQERGRQSVPGRCLLYTSDAADERSSVDLGGRRIITKK